MSHRLHSLSLGYISGLHGVAGGLRVHLHHEGLSSLRAGLDVTLESTETETASTSTETRARGASPTATQHEALPFCVDRFVPPTRGRVGRLWLSGIKSGEAATPLVGREVRVQRDTVPLEADEYLLADLIGLEVYEQRPAGAAHLGRAIAISSNGAQDLLEVEWASGKTWLLPLVPGFVDKVEDAVWVLLPAEFLPQSLELALAQRT